MMICNGCTRTVALAIPATFQPAAGRPVEFWLCGACVRRLRRRDRQLVELIETRLLLMARATPT